MQVAVVSGIIKRLKSVQSTTFVSWLGRVRHQQLGFRRGPRGLAANFDKGSPPAAQYVDAGTYLDSNATNHVARPRQPANAQECYWYKHCRGKQQRHTKIRSRSRRNPRLAQVLDERKQEKLPSGSNAMSAIPVSKEYNLLVYGKSNQVVHLSHTTQRTLKSPY